MNKSLSADNLVSELRRLFGNIDDNTTKIRARISLVDQLMSGFALFKLKYPSLLQFDSDRSSPEHVHNMKSLFGVNQAPSDTSMRERLDNLHPGLLRPAFKRLFALAQRSKILEPYVHLNGRYLLSIDGTGFFSSHEIHCENCCVKHHRDGSITYYHQMLAGVIVHPERKNVIPLCPEFIQKQDGSNKNDCERNAAKRFLEALKREHPHLSLIIVEDGLASNAPHIELLESHGHQYILGAKPKDHKWMFDYVAASQCASYHQVTEEGTRHEFEYLNDVPLNESNEQVRVNFIRYTEISPKGKKRHFTWVTNIRVSDNNIMKIMRGGRARWKIENETFNTLKNQGYEFEHNFGHGNKHLCQVLALMMMLAFLTDELQFIGCKAMQNTLTHLKQKIRLWGKIRFFFDNVLIPSWARLLDVLVHGANLSLAPDTS